MAKSLMPADMPAYIDRLEWALLRATAGVVPNHFRGRPGWSESDVRQFEEVRLEAFRRAWSKLPQESTPDA